MVVARASYQPVTRSAVPRISRRGDELADRPPARGRGAHRRLGPGQRAGHGRVTRRPQGPDRQVGRHALLHFRVRSGQFGQRGVELIAASASGVEEIRGTFENHGRGLLDPQRFPVDAVAVEPRLNDDAVQPDQLVDQAHGRPGGSAQSGWAVGRRQEGAAQRLDRLARLRSRVIAIQRKLFVHAAEQVSDPRPQPGGQRPAGNGRGTTQPVARWRGPQDRNRNQRDASGLPQPASRSGTADGGAASDTGKMNASSSAVVAPASTELTTPAKITPKPTTAIAAAASHAVCEASVARQTNTPPVTASAACAWSRSAMGPPKSTSSSIAKDPNAANVASCGLPMTLSPKANMAGMMIAARVARRRAAKPRSRWPSHRRGCKCASRLSGMYQSPPSASRHYYLWPPARPEQQRATSGAR